MNTTGNKEIHWLDIALQLQAIAQNGLTFTQDPFDKDRYEKILQISAEIMANHTVINSERIKNLFMRETGYATPKVDVRAVVFREDKVLLVKEKYDNAWSLPGGWADIGQSPSECVVREVKEESGYDVKAVKLLAVYDREKHNHPKIPYHVYKIVFLCLLTGGEPSASIETTEVGFFKGDNLPELSLIRVTPAQIHRYFEHRKNPVWPTDFD